MLNEMPTQSGQISGAGMDWYQYPPLVVRRRIATVHVGAAVLRFWI